MNKNSNTTSKIIDRILKHHPEHQEGEELKFYLPRSLETLQNAVITDSTAETYFSRKDYAHLKDVSFNLEEARLTDKQMIAVSLVFYGGVKKKRAAQAMKVSIQALQTHLNVALKKMQNSFW
ncbi:MAG: hypothetical protein ACE5EK_00780 [Nitrospinales bacterium]